MIIGATEHDVVYLILIKDKIFSENVGVTQALKHGVHEAVIAMIAKSNHSGRCVWRPNICVYRWYSIVLGVVCLERR